MIAHLVLLTPRHPLQPAEEQAFLDALERAVRDMPTVRGVRLGSRVTIGAGYEAAAPEAAFVGWIEFDDVAGLEAYLRHPAHADLASWFSRMSGTAYDFEVGTIEEFRRRRLP